MVSRELLQEHFLSMGATLTEEAIIKCQELCLTYSLSEEELAETWTVYSISQGMEVEPSVKTLQQMERAELGGKLDLASRASRSEPSSNLTVYNAGTTAFKSGEDGDYDDDILVLYATTPKAKDKNVHRVNKNTPASPRAVFSPASFSPSVSTPSARYATRSDSGRVLTSFGTVDSAKWHSLSGYAPTIKALSSAPDCKCFLEGDMYEASIMYGSRVMRVARAIIQKGPTKPSGNSYGSLEGCGRICYTKGNRLSASNVCLESISKAKGGHPLALNLENVPKFSLFPGQVVAVKYKVKNPLELLVDEILCDATLPLSTDPMKFPEREGPLQIVITSGPYTPIDSLTYEPLEDFVNYLRKHRPHVAFMIGPFIDAEHSLVKDEFFAESYGSLFEKQIDIIMQAIKDLNTQVILVASSRDIHHTPMYPTAAYNLKKLYPKLKVMGDPCILDVDGIKIGLTSVDVLKHIGNEEIVNAANSQDRLGRLAKHILMQRNFYPLFPPNEKLCLDPHFWEKHCELKFTPHIMVLPSDLRGFIKEAFGCVLVNPEHLAKGQVGGCFARLEINCQRPWDPSAVAGEILKI